MAKLQLFAIAGIAAAAVIAAELASIYVHEEFEKRSKYKKMAFFRRLMSLVARCGEKLRIGTEPALFRKISHFFSSTVFRGLDDSITIQDKKIDDVKVRMYRPKSESLLPLMVYFHGGAFATGSVDEYDSLTYEFAKSLNYIVISVDYRLAPEYPYPIPNNDCYRVVKYLIEHDTEFGFDVNKYVLVGDSSGGNTVAVITQRLAANGLKMPKLQVLVYPRVQFYTYLHPSNIKYTGKTLTHVSGLTDAKITLWYLGIKKQTNEMIDTLITNKHTLAIEDAELRRKYESYVDINLIPGRYKEGKFYYEGYTSENMHKFVYPSQLNENDLIKRDKTFAHAIRQLLTPDASPALASDETLKQLPRAYFVVCEWDQLKDQILCFAERLRLNGVPVDIVFYENAFHGVFKMLNSYQVARDMFNDVVTYIQEYID